MPSVQRWMDEMECVCMYVGVGEGSVLVAVQAI